MATVRLTGYHGTDYSVANEILNSGFKCKANDRHWLGNGIYLFQDKDLAEWWTTNPSSKHGIAVTKPVIIECGIEVDEERLLDLRNLKDYKEYVDLFNSFFRDWTRSAKENTKTSFEQLRCAFFNYAFIMYNIDIVIAPFILPNQPYLPLYNNKEYADEMHISYTEIQMCMNEEVQQKLIQSKIIHEIKR